MVPVIENHGLSLSEENGKEFIWITDTGSKGVSRPAQVLKSDLDGNTTNRGCRYQKSFEHVQKYPQSTPHLSEDYHLALQTTDEIPTCNFDRHKGDATHRSGQHSASPSSAKKDPAFQYHH